MKAYSVDLRERVLDAIAQGLSLKEVARLFQVSEGSIKRWRKRRRDGGSLEAVSPPGRPATINAGGEGVVHRLVQATPDATLAEYAEQWNALEDKSLSQWTFGRAVRRLGLSRKKRLS